MVGDVLKDVPEIGLGVERVELGCSDQRIDGGGALASVVPVRSSSSISISRFFACRGEAAARSDRPKAGQKLPSAYAAIQRRGRCTTRRSGP
jgi:hypothetical protein